VDTDVEFHEVDKWRGRAKDKKQGSDEENIIEWVNRSQRTGALKNAVENIALKNYNIMLEAGVAPEQARMILPQSMMTEWYWSGTLYAFARVCNLRCASDAQYETRIVANLINKECSKLFPISWTELRNT
jgi:thymidylate synthase (FAD)